MAYLGSNQIHVFPSANRSATYPKARLTIEENIVNIIKSITSMPSFVVSQDADTDLKFVINGYYFEVAARTNITDSFSSATNIYAHIKIGDSSGTVTFQELQPVASQEGLDVDSSFYGVLFDTNTTMPGTVTLHLLTRANTSATWTVPENSKIKLVTDNKRRTIRIDDGDLG